MRWAWLGSLWLGASLIRAAAALPATPGPGTSPGRISDSAVVDSDVIKQIRALEPGLDKSLLEPLVLPFSKLDPKGVLPDDIKEDLVQSYFESWNEHVRLRVTLHHQHAGHIQDSRKTDRAI